MSFILDALKKSESERHRHSGPVLMDVRIAPPRRRLPLWAWVIAGVLLVNLLLLVWLLWLAPDHAAAPVPTSVAASSPAPAAAPQTAAPPPAGISPTSPPTSPPAAVPAAVPQATATQAQPTANGPAPAMPADAGPATAGAPIDTANLPKVQDLIAAGAGLPEMHLSLHVYDPSPAKRYVLLNGAKLREGEFTPEGLKLLQITQTGAVLEWRGRRAFLGAGD
jgi:hypothetical protein